MRKIYSLMAPALLVPLAVTAQSLPVTNPTGTNLLVYGVADAYVGTTQFAGQTGSSVLSSGGMSTSQINLSGSKELGNGSTAELVLGAFYRLNDGGLGRSSTDVAFGRAAYVGLKGAWGGVSLGRQATGSFLNFIRINSFADSAAFGPAFLHGWLTPAAQGSVVSGAGYIQGGRTLTAPQASEDSAWNGTLRYASPKLFDSTVVSVGWAPGGLGVGNRSEVSAFYDKSGLKLGLSYENIGAANLPAVATATAVISEQNSARLDANYTWSWGTLSAGYSGTQRSFATIANDATATTYAGASIPAGPGRFIWQTAVSKLDIDARGATAASGFTRTTTSVGYIYNFAPQTELYAVAMQDAMTLRSDGSSMATGVRYRF